jgi:asparagine synthetase B (glutamine-hydrolysing)
MELDKEAIAEFLLLNYVLGDHSFVKGKKAKIPIKKPKPKLYDNATSEDVETALKNSIQKATKNKDKIGVLLSGGKDARLLLALTNSLKLDPTAITVGDVDNRYEEKTAKKVTKTLKVPHKIVRIPDVISPNIVSELGEVLDGSISFSGSAPVYLIKDELSDDFDLVLSGNLMTEIMDTCEFRWYDSKNAFEVMKRKHFQGGRLLKEKYRDIAKENFISRYKDKSLEEIILDTEFKNRSRAIIALNKLVDFSVATPAADNEVINATFSLPVEERMNGRLAVDIMKHSYPELRQIKSPKTSYPLYFPWWIHYGMYRVKERYHYYTNGGKIWAGKPRFYKMGMWDQGFVYKYKLGDYVKESLENFDFEMINHDFVKQVLHDHFAEKKDGSFCIPRLLTLKDWLDRNYT